MLTRCQAVCTFVEVLLDFSSFQGHPTVLGTLDYCTAALIQVSLELVNVRFTDKTVLA